MAFSGGLRLTDLDDYIAPSQACILPVISREQPPPLNDAANAANGEKQPSAGNDVDATASAYQVTLDAGPQRPTGEGKEPQLQVATISLTDCLACSGCITSAESVLVSAQSHHELVRQLEANQAAIAASREAEEGRIVCVSISPQTRASFAAKYGLTPAQVQRRLDWFVRERLGGHYVLDTRFSRDFALIESGREFCRRYRAAAAAAASTTTTLAGAPGHQDPATTTPTPTAASGQPLPLLTSACPGWICYAEKTHPYILPHVATTKSPQQIMGSLVKDLLARCLGHPPQRMYHVTVMPCYDKKLEASRADFYHDLYRTRDVDLVLTTGELEQLIDERAGLPPGVNVTGLPESPVLSDPFAGVAAADGKPAVVQQPQESGQVRPPPVLLGGEGSTSGGYLCYVLRYAAWELFGHALTPQDVVQGRNGVIVTLGRNADYTEYALQLPSAGEGAEARPVLRFVAAYGFRNIQNLVRKLKGPSVVGRPGVRRPGAGVGTPRAARGADGPGAVPATAADLHFVEVMACPSGCTNGGGQLYAPTAAGTGARGTLATKEWIQRVDHAYHAEHEDDHADAGLPGWREQPLPHLHATVLNLYQEWLGEAWDAKEGEDAGVGGLDRAAPSARTRHLHTQYHAPTKSLANPLLSKW